MALNPVCENVNYFFGHEMDVCSISKSGLITEFEVKVSKSDFKADAQKNKWRYFEAKVEKQIPNYFYYVCPEGLIKVEEVPQFAGLIYVKDDEVTIIKPSSRIHRLKHDKDKLLMKFCRVQSQRVYLGSCLMTYQAKIYSEQMKQRNETVNELFI